MLFSELLRAEEFGSRVPYEFSDKGVLRSGDISISCSDCPSEKVITKYQYKSNKARYRKI